ncbi:hypothetical protein DBR40_02430 [Pedobacter sp. KBW01]|uniref:hypothetical protein n=1 Tax=Pedobacter sp. KBW01 TaxID=2153364 RepID=UPI000F5A84F3|nr:hypothetical protein [Pedobacter sp. KBW01]RQO79833.1 hypothetical protein DBR40_02430 [Pedobacter sp. KBW01]
MVNQLEFKKRRDFGQVINDTFTFMRQNFKPLITTYFTFCGLFVLASMAAMLMQQYKMVNIINTGIGNRYGKGFGIGSVYGIEYFLSLLFSMASYSSMTVAVLSYIALYVRKGNQPPATDEVWGYFKYYFLRVFGSSILLILMLVVALICCLVPGFWLAPFVAMMFPIMVLENGSLGYAFSRSFKIIKDNFWVTFGTLVVVWIIVSACMSMIVLPTSLLNMVTMFTSKSPHMNVTLTMITTVLQSLCQVFTIIPVITISLVYYSLVEQKESPGLKERISNFGNNEKLVDTRPEEY